MINRVLHKITDEIDFKKKSNVVSYLNIYNYGILRKYPETVEQIDSFTLDGIMMLLFLKFFCFKKIGRKAPDFSSYFIELFEYFETKEKRVMFLGGSSDDMEKFLKVVKANYPNLNIIASQNGYEFERTEILNTLIENDIHAIITGLGTPKQELLITWLKTNGYEGACFSCGAFISQTALEGKKYFPNWSNTLHLRWLYRIIKEPKMSKRYFLEYPKALSFLLWDRFFKNKSID